MSLWDANLGELAQACADAGHRPIDRDHVLTCAVDACRELAEVHDTTVTVEERDEEVGERERERDEAQRAAEEAEKERDEAQREAGRLEDALEAAREEIARLEEALNGDEGARARVVLEAREEARQAREALADLRRDQVERLRRWATELDKPRAQRAKVATGMRNVADHLEGEG